MALGEPKDFTGGVSPGHTEFIFSSGRCRHGIHQWQLRGPADWRGCEGDGQPGDHQVGGDGSLTAEHIELTEEVSEPAATGIASR